MKNLYEDLQEQIRNRRAEKPEFKLLQEDPAKFLATSYNALTEDLDKNKMQYEKGSRDFVIARVLENEAKFLLEDTWTSKPTGQDFTFTTIAMPLVRKIFSKLIAMDLVSVQPINQPTAKIFYLDFQRHATHGDGVADESIYENKRTTYANRNEGGAVQEIDLKITQETVTAIEKALKALWTTELEQDLNAYHGLSAENELTTILQSEITREVDGLIIAALLAGAGGTGTGTGTGAGNVNWNINGQLVGDTSTTFIRDYQRTLYGAIVDASNLIFKKRYKYGTWIIGHPDAIVRLEKLEEFRISPDIDPYSFSVGRHLVGSLNDRFRVYKDPFFPVTNKLLMGYKGESWGDACGFYAPYIPLYVTPKIIDPNDFTPRKGLMSRFAYGTLIKDGLATVTLTES